ncbi:class I SAM-dependent methyltransferase [Variovorax sp.]|uniref:class I SAM-dependent methyltransferase n=1 Tax=Variovorax sp. TaxID=1871043 RepID=UPI002D379280|nr:class I SAM-dependent methyltransferase [Variovorax sp.]HYP85651.1 class I SAM-dependent methyltransferase [Variovorax sp.]
MQREELERTFDQQAESYDGQWARLAPLREAVHLLASAVFAQLPEDSRVLCVGAGTGAEMIDLARRFPGWRFMAVEPSAGMLQVCRRQAEAQGIADRCEFHGGYVDSLPTSCGPFDAATSLLVSQFLLQREERCAYFRAIGARLRPGGLLLSSDLAGDTRSPEFRSLLEVWFRLMSSAEVTPEAVERMRAAYARDVAILPPAEVAALIAASGFELPVQFAQTGMIHAWYSWRAPQAAG